jgi:hypothetical protein
MQTLAFRVGALLWAFAAAIYGDVGSGYRLECERSPVRLTVRGSRADECGRRGTARDDGCVNAVYPGDSDGDPMAVPGVCPETESGADVTSFTLEVDGEVFELRSDQYGAPTTAG